MKTRREVWREYAQAAASRGKPLVAAWAEADEMLRAEDNRFGTEDADIEQLKRELAEARDDNVLLNDRVDTLERELTEARAQLAASVPVAELREAFDEWRGANLPGWALVQNIRQLIEAAEQRAGKAES